MSKKRPVILDLEHLRKGIPALTPALGEVHAETAALCLEHQGHKESVDLHVREIKGKQFTVVRAVVTEQMRRAHADLQRATELGACGIGLLLAREITGLTAIQQSRKGTGFDYWLGPDDQPPNALVFQHSARLEVSGILSGSEKTFATRLQQKVIQSKPSDGTRLPAFAVVVEFSRPQAQVAKR